MNSNGSCNSKDFILIYFQIWIAHPLLQSKYSYTTLLFCPFLLLNSALSSFTNFFLSSECLSYWFLGFSLLSLQLYSDLVPFFLLTQIFIILFQKHFYHTTPCVKIHSTFIIDVNFHQSKPNFRKWCLLVTYRKRHRSLVQGALCKCKHYFQMGFPVYFIIYLYNSHDIRILSWGLCWSG